MTFDYKKEYREFYLPPKKPGFVTIPEINYLAVLGHGDPNEPTVTTRKRLVCCMALHLQSE